MRKTTKSKILGYGVSPVIALTGALYGAPALANELRLEEVIVSAQRREQSLQDVPIAVTAVDSEAMEVAKVENISNITALTPSVKFTSTNNPASSANVIIRGVGTVGNTRSFEGAVGVFIDDVYRTRAGAALESFLDIGSMQILKGPQGTLFGKNTTAGAILVESTEPQMEDGLTGSYNLSAGNYDMRKFTGALNYGINDTNAVRIAALYNDREGYYEDSTTGDDLDHKETTAIKLQWKSDLTDELSIHLIADSLESESDGSYATSTLVEGPATPAESAFTMANGLTPPSADLGDREATLNRIGDVKNTDDGLTLKVSWDTGAGTLKSVTSAREYDVDQDNIDADFTGVDIFSINESFNSEFFSQEFNFNMDVGDSGDLLLGAYYSNEDIGVVRDLIFGDDADAFFDLAFEGPAAALAPFFNADAGLYRVETMESEVTSTAVFAHLTYDLTDSLTAIAGIRYSEDEKDGSVVQTGYTGPAQNPNLPFPVFDTFLLSSAAPTADFTADFKDDAVSGVLGLQYAINDDMMAYLTYNRGYKSGGVILDVSGAGDASTNRANDTLYRQIAGLTGGEVDVQPTEPGDATFESETTDALELGLKASYWDGRATTNVAAFYTEIENVQIAQFIGLVFTVLNAETAETYGLEIENTFLLSEGLTLKADLNWLPHAEYGEYDEPIGSAGFPVLSGQRLIQSPEVVSNLGFNYETDISDDFALVLNGQYQYQGSRRITSANINTDESYDLINGSVSLVSLNNNWQIDLWGQNLTDEEYVVVGFNTPGISGNQRAYVGNPRTFGLTLRGEF